MRLGYLKNLSVFIFAGLVSSGGLLAGEVRETAEGYEFSERFSWQGNHAASILGGTATTVWWDEASWDVRGDTSWIAVTSQSAEINNRFHLDVHKAESPDPTDGQLSNTVFAVGGNGDPGVGVMHLDFQDILSARLRNPLMISADQPGVIDFYASAFVTTGHWWEIALSPTDQVIGAEYSSVPGQGEAALPGSVVGSEGQVGPGHGSPLDSINLVSFGATDVPCITGWWTRFGVTKTSAGATEHYVNEVSALNELTSTDPAAADHLEHWRMEVFPDSITLLVDREESGVFERVESWDLAVPWPEVFVHLMAVAYQADHHPQEPCFLGHIRELKWRDIRVHPVRYAATDVYPKNQGTLPVGRNEGWLAYDLRDIQRFGPAVNGAPQPNLGNFSTQNIGRYCNDGGFPCFGGDESASLTLPVPDTGSQLQRARVLADLKYGFAAAELPVSVALQGEGIIDFFEPARSSPAVEQEAWVRRSVELPVDSLTPGTVSTLELTLGEGSYLDRIEVEFSFGDAAPDVIFSDGFESGDLSRWSALP